MDSRFLFKAFRAFFCNNKYTQTTGHANPKNNRVSSVFMADSYYL